MEDIILSQPTMIPDDASDVEVQHRTNQIMKKSNIGVNQRDQLNGTGIEERILIDSEKINRKEKNIKENTGFVISCIKIKQDKREKYSGY